MKKNRQQEQEILRQIKELEDLYPRAKEAGDDPVHYAYSKPMAAVKIVGWFSLACAVFMLLSVGIFNLEIDLKTFPGAIFFGVMVLSLVAYYATMIVTTCRKTYVIISRGTLRRLDKILANQKAKLEEFAQQQCDAEIYRPKFDRLQPTVEELRGVYKPYWDERRPFWVWIRFRSSESERYDVNSQGYAKLLARIIEERCLQGNEDQCSEIIQKCESSLGI